MKEPYTIYEKTVFNQTYTGRKAALQMKQRLENARMFARWDEDTVCITITRKPIVIMGEFEEAHNGE